MIQNKIRHIDLSRGSSHLLPGPPTAENSFFAPARTGKNSKGKKSKSKSNFSSIGLTDGQQSGPGKVWKNLSTVSSSTGSVLRKQRDGKGRRQVPEKGLDHSREESESAKGGGSNSKASRGEWDDLSYLLNEDYNQ